MIITRTPFRISFFGGGTDLPAWYKENGGSVLSTTIDKYCYVSCRYLPPFFNHRYRVAYSRVEEVKNLDEIQHPVVRECIKYLNFDQGLEIHYDGDLPARAGMGTSSAFTVGLLNSLYGLKGQILGKKNLAYQAIEVEQEKIKEAVGSQDQTAAAFGGFNKIDFLKNGEIQVNPIILQPEKIKNFQNHLMLFFTGFSRTASTIESTKIKNISKRQNELKAIAAMVDQSLEILNKENIDEFGQLLDEYWYLKSSLTDGVSTSTIDDIYSQAKQAGALGGKLLGAGGGGFLLLFVKPEQQQVVREKFSPFLEVPFSFDYTGSQIVFYKPDFITSK